MAERVAVVTGASRGIGRQLSIDLAKEGYAVVCAARSTADSPGKLAGTVDETVAMVEKEGGEAIAVGLDVRDEDAVEALAERVYRELGRCDLLVNNAAVAVPAPGMTVPAKHWRLGIDVNVNGPLWLIRSFCSRMNEGRVVNVSSSASRTPDFGRPSYTVTKAALESLTECLAHELKGRVAVNCIRLELPVWSEGFVATLPEGDYSDFEDPVIMSDAVLWLARQPLSYTGHIVEIGDLRAMGAVRPPTRVGQR
jgi:citronellol/citronellal dehydrogenase